MRGNLIGLIRKKQAKVGVVGMGYVGLPLALRFSEAGFDVLGFDTDVSKAQSMDRRESYFTHIPDDRIAKAVDNGFRVSLDMSDVRELDAIIICVPTPLGKHREPDLSHIITTMESLAPFLRREQIIILESTTYPGTTDEEIVTRVANEGFTVGQDIFVAYSPEREDPGNKDFSTQTIPKVIGGYTENCLLVGQTLYGEIIDRIVPVSSTAAAEMTKLLENIHRAVNIGLVNELKILSDKMSIDIFEVIGAASSKPFGFTPLYPGPGLGGHCIPIDPFYLTWKAKEFGLNTRFIELAGEVNSAMPAWVVSKIEDALNQRGKAVNGSKIMVIGVAYKRDTNDTRESPGIRILSMLLDKSARATYHDPLVPKIASLRNYTLDASSVSLNAAIVNEQDCLVICTDHTSVDYQLIQNEAKLVVDTRNIFPAKGSNIVPA